MKNGDLQIGAPLVNYQDTTANIEELSGVPLGAQAYSTDDKLFGTYNGVSWDWATTGGGAAWGDISGTLADQTDLQTALNAKQGSDSDLTAIAGLSPSDDDVIQRKAGAWVNRTLAQLSTDLTELIQDIIGAMANAGTQTGLTVTYQDVTGTIDFVSKAQAETNADDIFRCDNPGGGSLFTGTIATLPGGAVLTYTPVSGNEGAMVPAATTQLAKMRLYNTTRGSSNTISNCNTGTNTLTLVDTIAIALQVGDTITIISQTVSGGGFNWVDLDIGAGFADKENIFMFCTLTPGAAGDTLRTHPFTTYAASKVQTITGQVATNPVNGLMLVKIQNVDGLFSIAWATTPTAVILRGIGYLK
jgi:hypothetical protein